MGTGPISPPADVFGNHKDPMRPTIRPPAVPHVPGHRRHGTGRLLPIRAAVPCKKSMHQCRRGAGARFRAMTPYTSTTQGAAAHGRVLTASAGARVVASCRDRCAPEPHAPGSRADRDAPGRQEPMHQRRLTWTARFGQRVHAPVSSGADPRFRAQTPYTRNASACPREQGRGLMRRRPAPRRHLGPARMPAPFAPPTAWMPGLRPA
jgi:hypothetical protein